MSDLIFKSDAYQVLKHEADSHMLPEYKEAYGRAARIVDQLRPVCISRYGRWVSNYDTSPTVYCSVCGAAFDKSSVIGYRGCPYCLSVLDS